MTDHSNVFAKLQGDSRAKTWIKSHLDYPHADWCVIWPFGRGEGTVQFGSDNVNVFRLMCEYRNGPPPTEKHQAAHSCGRRHDGCVNPLHLSWKTNSENQLERYEHSGRVKGLKLTPEQVAEIISLKDIMRVDALAQKFGVSCNNIRSIHAGRLWNNTGSLRRRVYSDDEVALIRSSPKTLIQLAEELGGSPSSIGRVKCGRTYKWIGSAT